MTKPRHPDEVLASLLATQTASRRTKLEATHLLCRERHAAGQRDFSLSTVGRALSERGLMNGRGLMNKGAEVFRDLLGAWQMHADHQWLADTTTLPATHPDAVLVALLARSDIKANRKASLRGFHELCRRHHATGTLDWSMGTVGRLCAQQGLLAASSIKNQEFKEFRQLLNSWSEHARPWLQATRSVEKSEAKPLQRSHDIGLTWVSRDYPEFEPWRELAAEWLALATAGLGQRIAAFSAFFQRYLTRSDVPSAPVDFLTRGRALPNFDVACPDSTLAVNYNNHICRFLGWVLLRDFSEVADDGARIVSPAFRNPLTPKGRLSSAYVPGETVRSPLPYGFVHELRHILAEGPDFRDWRYAQQAVGVAPGETGAPGRDWFDVPAELVDPEDPDCVWRVRRGSDDREVHQLWSPVRWVAVLVKLLLPLRTMQVRVLDSGESDTWVYWKGQWTPNELPLAPRGRGSKSAWQQGVFRRSPNAGVPGAAPAQLYINSNKTADQARSGPEKGYVIPWYVANDPLEDVFRWLEKLRDWQSKYNPIARRTAWAELDGRHIPPKSKVQLASYPDACFLFRMAELQGEDRRLPVSDGVVDVAWMNLLEELQLRLAARRETHPGGRPIELVVRGAGGRLSTEFPLHSLRVSLITALALDGEVPFPILQKLVGHSRLLMTLYYTKPGQARLEATLSEAAALLDAKKESSVVEFLLNAEHEELVAHAVANSASSLAAAVPVHMAARNAAGWMPMHHGLCLVGGNTSETEDNKKLGGCYNGGNDIGTRGKPSHGPVPGGSRNCVRCRWFVTEPHFLPALAAHFNTVAYHFDEARNKAMDAEQTLQELKRLKARVEADSRQGTEPFVQHRELQTATRVWETTTKRFSDLAEDLVACWRLIERCKAVLSKGPGEGLQLLVHGSGLEVQAVFEETESELLQLAGVCENLELYPDLDASQAVIRRSQLLDSALYNEGLAPVFVRLSEDEQLQAGNALLRRLAHLANPRNLQLGQREVIAVLDAGEKLSEHLGIDISKVMPAVSKPTKTFYLNAVPT
jgi:hypothetical protein